MSVHKTYDELLQDKKGKAVVVAVIDTGIDITHEDLKESIWVNDDEIPGNGIDDDKNGYIDDVNGWNFLGDAKTGCIGLAYTHGKIKFSGKFGKLLNLIAN